MKQPFIPGIYEHYKGQKYLVLGLAAHTETEERFVVYVPLYTDPTHTGPRLRVRPLAMFLEMVTIDNKTKPRFRYLGQEL